MVILECLLCKMRILFIYFIFCVLATWGMWDPSSRTRDRTCVPWTGSSESWPLDCQGSPKVRISFCFLSFLSPFLPTPFNVPASASFIFTFMLSKSMTFTFCSLTTSVILLLSIDSSSKLESNQQPLCVGDDVNIVFASELGNTGGLCFLFSPSYITTHVHKLKGNAHWNQTDWGVRWWSSGSDAKLSMQGAWGLRRPYAATKTPRAPAKTQHSQDKSITTKGNTRNQIGHLFVFFHQFFKILLRLRSWLVLTQFISWSI